MYRIATVVYGPGLPLSVDDVVNEWLKNNRDAKPYEIKTEHIERGGYAYLRIRVFYELVDTSD